MARLTRKKKAALVAALREGQSLDDACRALGLNAETVRRHSSPENPSHDPLFAQALAAVRPHPDRDNVAAVETAFMGRLLNGKATCSDYTFWLCNRVPGRWRVPQKTSDDSEKGERPARKIEEMTISEMLEAFMADQGEEKSGTN